MLDTEVMRQIESRLYVEGKYRVDNYFEFIPRGGKWSMGDRMTEQQSWDWESFMNNGSLCFCGIVKNRYE